MRLVTCSNSAARVSSAGGTADILPAGPGGVVPMVAALMRRHGGDWVFVASTADGLSRQSVTVDGATTTLHPHLVDPVRADQHHRQVSIQLFQWLFHYLHETSRMPLFDQGTWAAWEGYAEVNRQVAERVSRLCRDDADHVVLVNDHQLMLVPEYLRRVGNEPRGPLIYFHQLPWCQSDYFALLPRAARTRILASLLSCDVVGFHAHRWADAFLQCCERHLPAVDVDGSHVADRGHRTRVVVAPGPIDRAVLARIRADPATGRWHDRLTQLRQGRRMLVRAERFDLWKNVGRGLVAYERLLEQRPGTAQDTWFCALLSLPRRATDRHRADRARCEAIAARINDRFGRSDRHPVSLLYPEPDDNTRHRVVAALEMGAATLVNPTYDGLNLVAMESLLLSPDAPVVLSVNAGAHEILAPHTRGIDPFDVVGTSDALADALDGAIPAARWPGHATADAEDWLDVLLRASVMPPARAVGFAPMAGFRPDRVQSEDRSRTQE